MILNWVWIDEHVSVAFTVYGLQTNKFGMQSVPEVGKSAQKADSELDFRRSYVLIPLAMEILSQVSELEIL